MTSSCLLLCSPPADAIEAFDGRIQAHGFVEMQIRGLSEQYGLNHQELDLAQWYNVLNLELEFDILPDGYGPVDLMSAFVRVEARYDCIYTHGCGMFPSVNTFGNDVERLPKRLRDAEDPDYAGVIKVGEPISRIQNKTAAHISGIRETEPFGGLTQVPPIVPKNYRADWNYPGVNVDYHYYDIGEGTVPLPADRRYNYFDPGYPYDSATGTYLPRWHPGDDGIVGTVDDIGPDLIPATADDPRIQRIPGLQSLAGGVVFNCDPRRGCPSEPGLPVSDELNPQEVEATVKRVGFPGFDTFFDQPGGDLIPNTADDPGLALLGKYANYRFGLKDILGAAGGGTTTQIIGPWRPKDTVQPRAVFATTANPFRGRVVPSTYSSAPNYPSTYAIHAYDNLGNSRHNQRYTPKSWDLEENWKNLAGLPVTNDPPNRKAPIDPLAAFLIDVSCPGCAEPGGFEAAIAASLAAGLIDPFPEELEDFWENDYYLTAPKDTTFPNVRDSSLSNQKFGGDYSGIIPCTLPERNRNQQFLWNQLDGTEKVGGCIPFTNVRVTGGRGELPLRPAPDRSNLYPDFDPAVAQGLYIPSPGLLEYMRDGDFDNHNFNISQSDRAWNRGASQEDNKELKEAYLDIEWLDSRLWTRLGLQNIVWGKTELFRTTDQFNPVDIGLAGPLAGLEESRVALWAARFVYSLYNVGPLEDVRLEFAANLDDFEPIDLGACGEPYTINAVCGIPTGMFAHGALAIGVAGVDRPESFWDDIGELEFGGRIEWRWDRFSFALVDFVGYEDIPFADAIYYFDRSVEFGLEDLGTMEFGPGAGRPLASGFDTGCTGEWGAAGDMVWASANRDPKSHRSMTVEGVGRDPACLKPGGAAGQLNQNGFTVARREEGDTIFEGFVEVGEVVFAEVDDYGNPLSSGPATFGSAVVPIPCDPTVMLTHCEPLRYQVGLNDPGVNGELYPDGWSPQNALYNHTANQQAFAWICSATLTIGAALDPGACAWTLFGTPAQLAEGLIEIPFSEVLACLLSGENDRECQTFIDNVSKALQDRRVFRPSPLVSLNRDANDGVITATTSKINPALGTCPGGDIACLAVQRFLQSPRDLLTLDSTLTNEQRALLGCGPFYGTRCDSAAKDTTQLGPISGVVCVVLGIGCVQGGGIDFLNMEASALIQSFVGFEGTDLNDAAYADDPAYAQWAAGGENFVGTAFEGDGVWMTTSGLPQPGTIEFVGGPVCTRFVKELGDVIVLPGCRGANKILNRETAVADGYIGFQFDDGYDPRIDGCVLGSSINGVPVRGFYADGTEITDTLTGEPGGPPGLSTCFNDSDSRIGLFYEQSIQVQRQLENAIPTSEIAGPGFKSVKPGARTMWHPLAGCFGSAASAGDIADVINRNSNDDMEDDVECLITLTNAEIDVLQVQGLVLDDGSHGLQQVDGEDGRDYEADFFSSDINSQSQIFRSELAAFSWNFQMFLVQASCDKDEDDIDNDPECFDPERPYAVGKCSWVTPQFCVNVKGFFGAAGVLRNTVRAGGNGTYGRRTFLWHSGGELVIKYQRRNVFGFSMDFAEDVTKSNWGVEFTYVAKQNFFNNDDYDDNVTQSGVFNLTVSVDRPTFINFLNQNRTFFINSQWFFQYVPKYESGFTSNGPLNVLFTVAILTGYFQDRLNPQLVTVYDFKSTSGAVFPSVSYRFTEAFSAGIGLSFFYGKTQLKDMPVRAFAPAANRAGENAYMDGVDNALSILRDKDEVWLKLRWTF